MIGVSEVAEAVRRPAGLIDDLWSSQDQEIFNEISLPGRLLDISCTVSCVLAPREPYRQFSPLMLSLLSLLPSPNSPVIFSLEFCESLSSITASTNGPV